MLPICALFGNRTNGIGSGKSVPETAIKSTKTGEIKYGAGKKKGTQSLIEWSEEHQHIIIYTQK